MTYTRLSIPSGNPSGSPFDPRPRLYALLAVEVEPGKIVYYHLELDHVPDACTIEMERDYDEIHAVGTFEPLRVIPTTPIHIRAQLSGTVVSDRPDYRPPTRTHATTGPAALPGHPGTDPQPGADHE